MASILNRSRMFYIRLRPYELEQLRAAAVLARERPSAWARTVLLEAARRGDGSARGDDRR